MEIKASIDIEFHCSECGSVLEVDFAPHDDDRIDVTPCEKCVKEANNDGDSEGYSRGLEEADDS